VPCRVQERPGITPRELAEVLNLTRAAVSKVIDELQPKNWIACSTKPEDSRTLGQVDAIRVDEIQYARGHKYVTPVREMLQGSAYSRPFQIAAKMNKAIEEVRAGESGRMASECRTPLLKKSCWLLLKR
jgi:hypothetical protein